MQYLSVNEVLLLHARLIQITGGLPGIRDLGRLEAALARPQATFEGAAHPPDLWTQAAALMNALARNHPFVDGNKRTALAATGIFLALNGHSLEAGNDEAAAFTIRVASGYVALGEIARWSHRNSRAETGRKVRGRAS